MRFLFVLITFMFLSIAQSAERWIDMAWEPVEFAQNYELELYKLDPIKNESALIASEKTFEAKWSKQVSAGKYQFRMRAYDQRGVPGEWSDLSLVDVRYPRPIYIHPLANDILKGVELKEEKILFEWKRIEGVNLYFIEIWDNEGFAYKKFINDNQHQVWLKVAKKYFWRVVALDSEQDEIVPRDGEGVNFFLNGGGLLAPELSYKVEKTLHFEWDAPPLAESYDIQLFKKGINQKWTLYERSSDVKETAFKVPLNNVGQFRLAIKSQAFGRSDSNVAYAEFNINQDGTVDMGVIRIQESGELKSDNPFFYGYGIEYMSVDYDGISREKDTKVNTVIAGQRFFLESSYQDFFSRWKHRLSFYYQRLTNLDNQISLKEVNYLAGQHLVKWRIPFEMSLGLFYKEDLFIEADVFNKTLQFNSVANIGPFTRISPVYTINRYFDLAAEMKLYYHMHAVSTPNNQELKNTLTYSAQLSVTYHKNEEKSYTVFAGIYSSQIQYQATAGDSSTPGGSIAGAGTYNEANSTGKSVGIRFNSFF